MKKLLRSPFGIQEDSGWVTVTRRLDYEKRKNYVLEVTARDGGSPALKTSTRLEIEVEDENDNAPQFEDCNLTAVVQVSLGLRYPCSFSI